jgi:hypothetical protein
VELCESSSSEAVREEGAEEREFISAAVEPANEAELGRSKTSVLAMATATAPSY